MQTRKFTVAMAALVLGMQLGSAATAAITQQDLDLVQAVLQRLFDGRGTGLQQGVRRVLAAGQGMGRDLEAAADDLIEAGQGGPAPSLVVVEHQGQAGDAQAFTEAYHRECGVDMYVVDGPYSYDASQRFVVCP